MLTHRYFSNEPDKDHAVRLLASVRAADLDQVKDRFQSGGIPIFVEPDYTHPDQPVVGYASAYRSATSEPDWYRINVCLEDQFEEAKRLLADPLYVVKAPVDVEQFEETMEQLGANQLPRIVVSEQLLNRIPVGTVVALVAGILYAALFLK